MTDLFVPPQCQVTVTKNCLRPGHAQSFMSGFPCNYHQLGSFRIMSHQQANVLELPVPKWLLSSSKYLISRWFPVLPKELLPGIHIESLSPMFSAIEISKGKGFEHRLLIFQFRDDKEMAQNPGTPTVLKR